MAVPFSNTKLRVPKGFQNVLEGLAREVLRCQPDNIYSFSAAYFEELLRKRQETGFDDVTLLGAQLEDRFYNNHSFKNPSLNTNSDNQQSAAVVIQSEYRRFAAKKEVDALKEEEAASVIQASIRGHMDRTSGTGEEINLPFEISKATVSVDRRETQEKSEDIGMLKSSNLHHNAVDDIDIDLNDPDVEKAALKIQSVFKGFKTRRPIETVVTKESKEKSEAVVEPTMGASKHSVETTPKVVGLIEEEVIDIDLEDPDVEKAALKIQSVFKGFKGRKRIESNEVRSNLGKVSDVEVRDNSITQEFHEIPVKSSVDEIKEGIIQEQQEPVILTVGEPIEEVQIPPQTADYGSIAEEKDDNQEKSIGNIEEHEEMDLVINEENEQEFDLTEVTEYVGDTARDVDDYLEVIKNEENVLEASVMTGMDIVENENEEVKKVDKGGVLSEMNVTDHDKEEVEIFVEGGVASDMNIVDDEKKEVSKLDDGGAVSEINMVDEEKVEVDNIEKENEEVGRVDMNTLDEDKEEVKKVEEGGFVSEISEFDNVKSNFEKADEERMISEMDENNEEAVDKDKENIESKEVKYEETVDNDVSENKEQHQKFEMSDLNQSELKNDALDDIANEVEQVENITINAESLAEDKVDEVTIMEIDRSGVAEHDEDQVPNLATKATDLVTYDKLVTQVEQDKPATPEIVAGADTAAEDILKQENNPADQA